MRIMMQIVREEGGLIVNILTCLALIQLCGTALVGFVDDKPLLVFCESKFACMATPTLDLPLHPL